MRRYPIAGLIVGHCPDQLQIPGLLWTRSAVRALIERESGVRLEISTVGRYLRAWGFTLQEWSGPVEKVALIAAGAVLVWLASRVRRIGAPVRQA